MNSIKFLFIFFLACASVSAAAQTDTLKTKVPAVISFDSTEVHVRQIDEATISELKKSPEFDYGTGPAVSTLWERFKLWLSRFFRNIFSAAIETDWVNVLIKVAVVVILIYVILRLLRIDALKVFYSGAGKSIKYATLDENIHEMDFDTLIEDAIRKNDYRLAIRLQFLQALKILSDKHLIHWQPGKTNHDYLDELKEKELKKGFDELNYYFEYAWYGNFKIAPELFGKVKTIYNNWIAKT